MKAVPPCEPAAISGQTPAAQLALHAMIFYDTDRRCSETALRAVSFYDVPRTKSCQALRSDFAPLYAERLDCTLEPLVGHSDSSFTVHLSRSASLLSAS